MDQQRSEANIPPAPGAAPYSKPKLEKLGTFRELTRCGEFSWWRLLFGSRDFDGCSFSTSSSYTWYRQ